MKSSTKVAKKGLGAVVKRLDCFGVDFRFNLPNGDHKKRSFVGVFTTLIAVFLILFYGTVQFLRLIGREQPDVMVSVRDNYFGLADEFT